MATPISRTQARREGVIDEALAHALDIMAVDGAGGLSISEMARRMGIRPPSLYKYFPSLHAVYDEIFRRGSQEILEMVHELIATGVTGIELYYETCDAMVRWCFSNQAMAQLLFWRPVPGFTPSAEAFAPSAESMDVIAAAFRRAIDDGHLRSDTDLDEFLTLYTVMLSGLISQQLANEPHADFESGRFTSRTRRMAEIFINAYLPRS